MSTSEQPHATGAPNRSLRLATLSVVCLLLLVVLAYFTTRRHTKQQEKAEATAQHTGPVNFSRDIRPILNQNCVGCHGGVRQKGGVSFIFRDEALGTGKSGRRTIVPGNPDSSELMARVLSHDSESHMPYHGPMLNDQQVGLLRQWIKEGAQFDDYWAFVAPKAQAVPEVKQKDWARQPLDRFILARLEKEGLKPSAQAAPAELLRRASLDITGLPPTAQEEAAYLADSSPNAYEKQVERLLASPRYGERWASMWLDLARYADSMGFEKDMSRTVWPYRDWVINAYNANMPYDQFVIKQLAGDLLPNATINDRIATAFHRQTPNNEEGGTDDEEFRMIAVMDRVATTWQITSGITMNCVQCHSHPYDPIKHADYYRSLAFFNTQRDADLSDDSPTLRVPMDTVHYPETGKLQNNIRAMIREIESTDRAMEAASKWQQVRIDSAGADDLVILQAKIPGLEKALEKALKNTDMPAAKKAETIGNAKKALDESRAQVAQAEKRGDIARTFTLKGGEIFAKAETPAQSVYQVAGKSSLRDVTALRLQVPPIDAAKSRHTPEDGFIVNRVQAFVLSANGTKTPIPISYFAQDSEGNLMAAEREGERPRASAKSMAAPAATAPAKAALKPTAALRSEDGLAPTAKAKPAAPAGNAKPKNMPVPPPPVKLAFAQAPVSLPEELPSPFSALPKLFETRWIIAVPAEPVHMADGDRIEVDLKQTSDIDNKPAKIQRLRIDVTDDKAWTNAIGSHKSHTDQLFALDKQLNDILSVGLPVMAEQQPYERRATLEFERGNFLTKVGPNLEPDTPAIFPKFPAGVPRNRLTLAKWFFQPGQPLTARVAVNRYWEELFGTGIVETLENFGSVGEIPSHPELLDWLALHFQNDLHWNMKALVREIVTSATYRQSAAVTPQLLARDQSNRLLARGPRQRLTAEMVRDQALVASGLLSTKMGGVPVMPPQPEGIWNTVYSAEKWTDATGPDRYRRAVYTFVKRTSGYPSSLIFDASDRDVMLPRRLPTNTPLQALVTLNDPVYQEASVALARRAALLTKSVPNDLSGEATLDARLRTQTELVLSRQPTEQELAVLRKAYHQALEANSHGKLVRTTMSVGREPSRAELAALTTVSSILFNLDAALVR